MSTIPLRVPKDTYQEANRLAALCGEQPGVLLARAWREYVANHRDEFAADLEEAARLIRNETLDELVTFVQKSHQVPTLVDADELEEARRDPKVRETLKRAKEMYDRLESEGRNL